MDTNTNFRITIPKPCHEDWNKFTPDEKGAFCKVCSKSVHDFTKKEPEQIKTILIEEMSAGNKVCGRFNEDQITPSEETAPTLDTYSLNFQKLKKFAAALILVFGGFLFNSVKSSAQKMGKIAYNYREPVRGEIVVAKAPETLKDTSAKVTKCNMPLKGDVAVEVIEPLQVMGGVKAMPVEQPKGQVTIIEEPLIETLGEVMIMPGDEPIIGDTTITIVEDLPMMGLVAIMPEDIETPILIDPIPSDSIQNIVDGEFAVEESTLVTSPQPSPEGDGADEVFPAGVGLPAGQAGLAGTLALVVYPNPTANGIITLRYTIPNSLSLGEGKGEATISLYDLKGNLVKTLLPLQSLYASLYETKYDVSNLQDGIYICEMVAGSNRITTRIVIAK